MEHHFTVSGPVSPNSRRRERASALTRQRAEAHTRVLHYPMKEAAHLTHI